MSFPDVIISDYQRRDGPDLHHHLRSGQFAELHASRQFRTKTQANEIYIGFADFGARAPP